MTDAFSDDRSTPQQQRDARAQPTPGEAPQRVSAASCTQERMWFLDQFEPNSTTYNMTRVLRLTGPLDVEALRKSIDTLVARHEALRTVFAEERGQPVQVVCDDVPTPLVTVDLSAEPDTTREQRAEAIIEREGGTPFDLSRGPLFHVRLLTLGERDHVLMLCMHHIIADGWSMSIVSDELRALYDDYAAGRAPALDPPPIQFADYAQWERDRLDRGELDEQIAQWKQLLAGAPPVLDLPGDRPRPAAETHRGKRLRFEVSAPLTEALRQFARGERATLYMALLSVFEMLLYRYSGQQDIVIGTPMANRNRSEVERVIGFFANTLPLRVRIDGEQTIRELIQTVRNAAIGVYAVSEVPFERLVQELAPARNLSHAPLFQVMMSYNSISPRDWKLGDAHVQIIDTKTETAKFDLMFHFQDKQQGLSGYLEYNTDLFNDDTAKRMLRHFLNLAQAVADDPQATIAHAPMLSQAERQQIVEAFNATHVDYGDEAGLCLHELFAAQVARTPDAMAVRFADEQVTFAQLDERASRLADQLRGCGVQPDALVAVCMDRSIDMVIAMLATLKAGGAYVPVDPDYPAKRIGYMIEDSQPVALITQPHLKDRLPAQPAPVLCIDAQGDARHADPAPHAQQRVTPRHLAYVIYTSGSTGRPKGVAIEHRAIVNHMLWMRRVFPLTAADRVLQKTPTSFDASVWEFYASLISGAQLVMAQPQVHRSPRELIQAVMDHRITTLQLVPTMLDAMLDEPTMQQCVSLRRVFCGGEALTTRLATRLRNALPNVELINLYGPTEATIDATFHRCLPGDATQHAQPIGRPIDNMRAYVLDAHMQPQPIGVPGALHLAGAGLARGYLNAPQLTAERFVPDTVTGRPGERLYSTGDRARLRADGAIEFLGRIDQQVKLRGHRIELGEIESVLMRDAQVAGCVVMVCEDDPGQPRLVAYLQRAAPGADDDRPVRETLRAELPDYMTPAAFVWLDALPQLPNGKIDRSALPAPDRSDADEARRQPPRTPMEQSLASIWCEILKLDLVGVHDNFFDLGGHSLMAAQIASRIRNRHGIELPLRVMFESPTIAELAQAVEHIPANTGPATPAIKRIDRSARTIHRPAASPHPNRKDSQTT